MMSELNNFKVETSCGKCSNDKYKIQYSSNFPFKIELSQLSMCFSFLILSYTFPVL